MTNPNPPRPSPAEYTRLIPIDQVRRGQRIHLDCGPWLRVTSVAPARNAPGQGFGEGVLLFLASLDGEPAGVANRPGWHCAAVIFPVAGWTGQTTVDAGSVRAGWRVTGAAGVEELVAAAEPAPDGRAVTITCGGQPSTFRAAELLTARVPTLYGWTAPLALDGAVLAADGAARLGWRFLVGELHAPHRPALWGWQEITRVLACSCTSAGCLCAVESIAHPGAVHVQADATYTVQIPAEEADQ